MLVRLVQLDLTVVRIRVRNVRVAVDSLFSDASGSDSARKQAERIQVCNRTHVGQSYFCPLIIG